MTKKRTLILLGIVAFLILGVVVIWQLPLSESKSPLRLFLGNGSEGSAKDSLSGLTAGTHKVKLNVKDPSYGMLQRNFYVYLPKDYDASAKYPLLFMLHGSGGSAERIMNTTGFNKLADQEKFIVIYPQALGISRHDGEVTDDFRISKIGKEEYPAAWNVGRGDSYGTYYNVDDLLFFENILTMAKSDLSINDQSIFVSGISNGGGMAQKLVANMPDTFAGAALVSTGLGLSDSDLSNYRPIPTIIFHGTADEVVPYEATAEISSTPERVEMLAGHNQCAGEPEVEPIVGLPYGVEMTTYTDCAAPVVFYTVFEGEHLWYQPYAKVIWDFFTENAEEADEPVVIENSEFCQGPIFGTFFYNGAVKRTDWRSEAHKELFIKLWDYGFVGGSPHFIYMQPNEGDFRFAALDANLAWFKDNGVEYSLYHHLVTPKFKILPQWYINAESNEERRQMLENHVRTVVRYYKGQIPVYIVVNHVVNNSFNTPEYENNYLLTGWSRFETVKKMLEWAHEEDPEAKLIINETGTDFYDKTIIGEENNQDYFDLVKQLVDAGAPLDGLGIMAHMGSYNAKMPSNESLNWALDKYAEAGVPIYVTELDVSYNFMEDPIDPEEPFEGYDNYWDYQADAYKRTFEVFNSHPAVEAVYMWGFVDSGAWREGEGLFDEQFEPKPAYYAVEDFLKAKKACNN